MPGVARWLVGILPREISTPTALVGFVSAKAKSPEAAKALLKYLSSPEAAEVYKAMGMQAGRGLSRYKVVFCSQLFVLM
ncbi:MAG: substrate-binding domain-containing protein [Burkholderiales bacterium]